MTAVRPFPSYLALSRDELDARAARAVAMLADCRACPRDCGVNRLEDRWAACKTGRYAAVSSYFPHFGEEDCLRGWNGSGTIFFTHCNLRCVFCQNYDISQDVRPPYRTGASASLEQSGVPPHELAGIMLELQALGCHNINFVTPEHVAPQIAAFDDEGLARRGVLIRHLVMPGCLDETRAILEWIATTLGPDTYVNLMDQYYPAGKVSATSYTEINRRLTSAEFREARRIAADLGLRRIDERRPHARLLRRMM